MSCGQVVLSRAHSRNAKDSLAGCNALVIHGRPHSGAHNQPKTGIRVSHRPGLTGRDASRSARLIYGGHHRLVRAAIDGVLVAGSCLNIIAVQFAKAGDIGPVAAPPRFGIEPLGCKKLPVNVIGLYWRITIQGIPVAKVNYQFDKRQRDLAKKKKQEDKLLKKQARNAARAPGADTASTDEPRDT